MIVLRADNRTLVGNSKFSYLVDNYASGVSSVSIVNTEGFSANDFILIGEFGDEKAEIFRVGSVNSTTGALSLQDSGGSSASTSFSHPESTKVYVIPYNQIRFYWTAATGTISDENPVFDTDNPLTNYVDLEPGSIYTTHSDSTHSTGFGWFIFYNSVTQEASQESNPIPYTGFDENTVATIFEDFDSLLNVNELKLVSVRDKFSWFNEGLSLIKNKLNLSNIEYTVSDEKSLSIVSGTAEYLLDSDFSDLVYINDGTSSKVPIPHMPLYQAANYTGSTTVYSLRGRYIVFTPTPTSSATYKYRYRAKATRVTSLSTYISLPDNGFYAIKDWMMYRACLKFSNPLYRQYYESFTSLVNLNIQSAVKRDTQLDSWGIADQANT